MLVLSRKVGERVLIGKDISVTVVSTGGRQVKLGIHAPLSVPIRREELAEQRQSRRQVYALPFPGRESWNAIRQFDPIGIAPD